MIELFWKLLALAAFIGLMGFVMYWTLECEDASSARDDQDEDVF